MKMFDIQVRTLKDPRRRGEGGIKASSENFDCYCKQPRHMKKSCSKYMKMLKKIGGPGADRACTSEKQRNQASRGSGRVVSVNSGRGKGRFSDTWLLDSGCTYQMCPKKEWFSTYKPFEGGPDG